ncbi:MAG: FG-GAP-like repeat-containing protein, partial [Holophagales bacterium]|nr:FG-GAP-like repeat-containing protein [Holophagales bacterium]
WSAAKTVDAFHNGALGVAAADFDADGDLDIVATQSKDGGKVTWYANDDGAGGSFTAHDLTSAFDGAAGVAVADLDRNGTADIVAAAATANDVAFFPNRGGQFRLETANTSPVALGNSVTDDVLSFVADHNGLVGEQDGELTSIEILFEELAGDPLTSGEANQVVENLFLYLDDGAGASPGTWDGADTLVATVANLTLDADGVQSIPLVADDPNVRLVQGSTETYFVVVETTATYTSAGLTFLRLTHLTESSSTANDQVNDTPLRLEGDPNVVSNDFEVNTTGATEADLVLVSITDSPDPVSPGANLTYTITVGNNGPWPALDVTVDSTLSVDTTFVSTNGCTNDPSGNPTCSLGSISPGGQKSFDLTVAVSGGASGSLTYMATADTATTQISTGDESGSEATTVTGLGDVRVEKSSIFADTNTADFAPGESVRYSIRVWNNGPGDDPSVTVVDTFPADVMGVTWSCTASGGAGCPVSGAGNLNESVSLPDGSSALFLAT